MILVSYYANKSGTLEELEEEPDVLEGDYFDENELYIVNETKIYDFFDTYENAQLCVSKIREELKKYRSNLKVAGLDKIECEDGVLVFEIVNLDLENPVTDSFRVTISKEGTAIERLS
ncbi:MAG: hypothetical protein MJ246_07205 [Clostridia bacterium]|nr:hypothetical protein [Clostridia bacterium]